MPTKFKKRVKVSYRDDEWTESNDGNCHEIYIMNQQTKSMDENIHHDEQQQEDLMESSSPRSQHPPIKKQKGFIRLEESNLDDQHYDDHLTFPDDIVFHVMQFLGSTFIWSTCVRVCKQWYSQACAIPLSLDFSKRKKQSIRFDVHYINNMLNLTKLDLSSCIINDQDLKYLSNCGFKNNLKFLTLWRNNIGSRGAGHIASTMRNLTYLDLYYNCVGVKGAKLIATSEHLKNLTFLNLGVNPIRCEGVRALCSSQHVCQNLEVLKVGFTSLGIEGAKCISNCEKLQNLNQLDISNNTLGAEGAKYISTSVYLKNLTYLCMNGNDIGDEGVKFIATSECMKKLKELHLQCNNVGDQGAKYLSHSEHVRNIIDLDLSSNMISDDGATRLGTSEVLKHLQVLDLTRNKLTVHGVGIIRQHLSDLLYFHH
nr:unnamed protein product [Naegleria fowleri]